MVNRMQSFVPYLLGKKHPAGERIANTQRCFRAQDIEEVGDKTHLTFFEMLGNFSFGPVGKDNFEDFGKDGYFKRSAIFWAYEFITQVLGISVDRIKVSAFKGDLEIPLDKESYEIWHEEIGISKDRIILGERVDNFWGPTGEEGPCGPTTEIYVNPSTDGSGQAVEIWNIVFNQYYCRPPSREASEGQAPSDGDAYAIAKKAYAKFRKAFQTGSIGESASYPVPVWAYTGPTTLNLFITSAT